MHRFLDLDPKGPSLKELTDAAREWIAGDPDEASAAQLEEMIDAGDAESLKLAMGGRLEFGTAGIRGRVGPGSNQMNRAVVIKTTRGLAEFLLERHEGPPGSPVIVGFDARPTSRLFAEDAVGVLCAAGIRTVFFPEYVPTPLVAFAARTMGAAAAVVVTASHNPPADNGYKVYDANAAQIIPPVDSEISHKIEAVGRANEVPRVEDAFNAGSELARPIQPTIADAYWHDIDSYRPQRPAGSLRIAYTPLHGVGGATVADVFSRTTHRDFHRVEAQFSPDGRFPTVEFPNPEEPGALDMAMQLGGEIGAELILANDPDADRLAAAVPWRGGWRLFTGNELGALLGSFVLDNWKGEAPPITANSIVSSPMLSQLSSKAGGIHLTTLTGFKWIANAALAAEADGDGIFAFGYEEALGYSLGRSVRDKDGISAALALSDLAAVEKENGRSLLDTLAALWRRTGIWVSTQKSLIRDGEAGTRQILAAVDTLSRECPPTLGGLEVTEVTDYRQGADARPRWLGAQALVEVGLGSAGRVLARPSGTEPKLKIYVDLRTDPGEDGDIHSERDRLLDQARLVAEATAVSINMSGAGAGGA